MGAVELLQEAHAKGLQVLVAGERLVVRGPRELEPLALRLLDLKPVVMRLLASEPCSCGAPQGPAVINTFPHCLRCGRSWRCPDCGGCRACKAGVQPGEQQRGREELHRRLQVGQAWLKEVWGCYCAQDRLTEKMQARFLEGRDRWDNLDKALRELYAWQGCGLGPGRHCDDSSPIVCASCERFKKAVQSQSALETQSAGCHRPDQDASGENSIR